MKQLKNCLNTRGDDVKIHLNQPYGKMFTVSKELIEYLRSCKCQDCLGRKSHYSAEYCHVAAFLNEIIPGWINRQQGELLRLGMWSVYHDLKEHARHGMERNTKDHEKNNSD